MGWGVKADIWSYGVVVSELFAKNGELFFQCATEDTTKEATLFLPLAGLEELILDPLALEFVLFVSASCVSCGRLPGLTGKTDSSSRPGPSADAEGDKAPPVLCRHMLEEHCAAAV